MPKENIKPPKIQGVGEESIADTIKSMKQEDAQRRMEKEVYPPKAPVVKKARGGYVKAADGCAQRGKTKGRIL